MWAPCPPAGPQLALRLFALRPGPSGSHKDRSMFVGRCLCTLASMTGGGLRRSRSS